MIDLPPLPNPAVPYLTGPDDYPEFTADQMRSYGEACALAGRARWIGYCASMAGIERGASVTLGEDMAQMAAWVTAEIKARKNRG
jgi:hypothetical protein